MKTADTGDYANPLRSARGSGNIAPSPLLGLPRRGDNDVGEATGHEKHPPEVFSGAHWVQDTII